MNARDATYAVYLLRCSDGTFYTGITRDIERRLRQHNGVLRGGAAYTRSRRPVALVYSERCGSRGDALRRECELKKLTRIEKQALCSVDDAASTMRVVH